MVMGQALEFSLPVGDKVPEEGGRPDYDRLVAGQLKALRERAGLTSEAMADALSRELGRRIQLPSVSRWENGHQTPKSDVLIAAMRVAGLPYPADAPKDPRRALEQELEDLRRQVEMMARRLNHRDVLPILPQSHRTKGRYLTVVEAANRLGVTRETVYSRVRKNQLRAFVWMGHTVILPEDLASQEPDQP